MKEKKEGKYLQSYCYTEFGNFFVSTIYRESSASLDPIGWYYETYAWTLDKKGVKDKWIADNSGTTSEVGARRQHREVEEELFKTGKFEESDD